MLTDSFYQSADYRHCLVTAGWAHWIANSLLVVRTLDDGLESWEAAISGPPASGAWQAVVDMARLAGLRYARMCLAIGATATLPQAHSFPTILISTATAEPFRKRFIDGARRAAKTVEPRRIAFDEDLYSKLIVGPAVKRGYIGEVDHPSIMRAAAGIGRLYSLAAFDRREMVAALFVMRHDLRVEIRYSWRSKNAVRGALELLHLHTFRFACELSLPYLDLGGLPADTQNGIYQWKRGATSAPVVRRSGALALTGSAW